MSHFYARGKIKFNICQLFQVGEIRRHSLSQNPELLPYGYIFGDVVDIKVRLRRATSQHRGSGITQPPVDELVTVLAEVCVGQLYLKLDTLHSDLAFHSSEGQ
jgi:hypothetical protein